MGKGQYFNSDLKLKYEVSLINCISRYEDVIVAHQSTNLTFYLLYSCYQTFNVLITFIHQ